MELTLVDIHDTDLDHEIGGQDLPNLVTVKVEGISVDDAISSNLFSKLEPFNVQASEHLGLPGHIEFCTFSFDDDIQRHFGIEPKKSDDDIAFERYCRRTYVRTVGELRAAIADLPDDFPLIHTGRKFNPDGSIEQFNALGIKVHTGTWIFTGPGLPEWGDPRWSLRLGGFDPGDWAKVMDGTWRDFTAASLKRYAMPNISHILQTIRYHAQVAEALAFSLSGQDGQGWYLGVIQKLNDSIEHIAQYHEEGILNDQHLDEMLNGLSSVVEKATMALKNSRLNYPTVETITELRSMLKTV